MARAQHRDNTSLALAPIEASTPARSVVRRYELGRSPQAALELLRTLPVRVMSEERAREAKGSEPIVVVRGDSFTIYQPWRSDPSSSEATLRASTQDMLGASIEAMLGADLSVGPALVGELCPTPRGARLELRMRRFAPAPAERFSTRVALFAWAAVVLAPLLIAGLQPVALGLSALLLAGGAARLFARQRKRRSQDLREMLSLVEGVFGPQELGSAEDAPHRRDDDERGLL